jgi:ribose 5-phosphate isomerase B
MGGAIKYTGGLFDIGWNSAHQGVEDDNMNMICLGGLVVGHALAWELVKTFLQAKFSGAERFRRRLTKVAALEHKEQK